MHNKVTERLAQWLDMYQMSLGSFAFMITEMLVMLQELGNAEAVELAEEAKAKQERARQLDYDWEQQKQDDPLGREGTQKLDNIIDSTLSKLVDGAELYVDLEEETEQTRMADEFLSDLFSAGVFVITSKDFDDQHTTVNELIGRLRGEYTEHVEKLNLEPVVSQLETLNAEFGERLKKSGDDRVSYDQVQTAYVEAEDAFHRLFVQVLADYADDMETLNKVLAPLHEQTERTRRSIQSRGTVPEVDPETGEPVEPVNTSGDGSSSEGEQHSEDPLDGENSEGDGS